MLSTKETMYSFGFSFCKGKQITLHTLYIFFFFFFPLGSYPEDNLLVYPHIDFSADSALELLPSYH